MDREAWRAEVHGVTKSWTRLSDWTELNLNFHPAKNLKDPVTECRDYLKLGRSSHLENTTSWESGISKLPYFCGRISNLKKRVSQTCFSRTVQFNILSTDQYSSMNSLLSIYDMNSHWEWIFFERTNFRPVWQIDFISNATNNFKNWIFVFSKYSFSGDSFLLYFTKELVCNGFGY